MKFLNNFSKRSRISLESIEFYQEISNEFSNNFQMYKGSTHANVTCLDLFNIKKTEQNDFKSILLCSGFLFAILQTLTIFIDNLHFFTKKNFRFFAICRVQHIVFERNNIFAAVINSAPFIIFFKPNVTFTNL